MKAHVVFCDFDGTVTTTDTNVAMFHHFAPDLANELIDKMLAREIPVGQGVRTIIESIPSSRYEELLDWCRNLELRDGLIELLDFLDAHDTPFVLVSGGLRIIADSALGPLAPRVEEMYAVELDLSGPTMKAVSAWQSDTELVDKVAVMGEHPAAESVAIGDSITDIGMSHAAQVVFARDRLADYMNENAMPFEPFRDFHDVVRVLDRRWPKR